MNKQLLGTFFALSLTGGLLAGCAEEGPAERAGEQIDETAGKVGDSIEETGEKAKDGVTDDRNTTTP